MPKNSSTSASCTYALRSKRNVGASVTGETKKAQPSIKQKRATLRKKTYTSNAKSLSVENDGFEVTEQIAKEWIARENAPPSNSATDWLITDAQFAAMDKHEEQEKIDLASKQALKVIEHNQFNAFFQMQEYQKRQEIIEAEINALTGRIKKMGNNLEQLGNRVSILMPQHFGCFSFTQLLADMEPQITLDLETPDYFPLRFNKISQE